MREPGKVSPWPLTRRRQRRAPRTIAHDTRFALCHRVLEVLSMLRQLTSAALFVALLLCVSMSPSQARVRTYYIAADEVLWNYVPSGTNLITKSPLPPLLPQQL